MNFCKKLLKDADALFSLHIALKQNTSNLRSKLESYGTPNLFINGVPLTFSTYDESTFPNPQLLFITPPFFKVRK